MQTFSYRSGNHNLNVGMVLKSSTSKPSLRIDFADALRSSSVTVDSVGCIAIGSTGATATVNWVGTTSINGTLATVDLRTGGSSTGTDAATNGDMARVRATAILSNGGPATFDVFVIVRDSEFDPD